MVDKKISVDSMMQSGLKLDPQAVFETGVKPFEGAAQPDLVSQFRTAGSEIDTIYASDNIEEYEKTILKMVGLAYSYGRTTDGITIEDMAETAIGLSNIRNSFILPREKVEEFERDFKRLLAAYVEYSKVDESNEREKVAAYIRGANLKQLKALFITLNRNPKTRRLLEEAAKNKEGITEETFREGEQKILAGLETLDIGELQKIFSPLLSILLRDRETRYYVNLAIDEVCQKRTAELLEDLEKMDEPYFKVINIGFGVYGQVLNNELMHQVPELAVDNVLTIDANPWIGGQFAVGTKGFFRVNNRVRKQKRGSKARPGTEDNIMPVGEHAVVDLPAVSSKTYPEQNLLGSTLKVNGFLNSGKYALGCSVLGIRPSDGTKKGKWIVTFVNKKTNKVFEVSTDVVNIADGPGRGRYGFDDQFDIETREIVSMASMEGEDRPPYYTFQGINKLASVENGVNWREEFSGVGAVIGGGDSGIVTVAGILGYGPDEEGSTQQNFTEKIYWIGQPATDSDKWCKLARPRYVDLAREFRRPGTNIESGANESATSVAASQEFLEIELSVNPRRQLEKLRDRLASLGNSATSFTEDEAKLLANLLNGSYATTTSVPANTILFRLNQANETQLNAGFLVLETQARSALASKRDKFADSLQKIKSILGRIESIGEDGYASGGPRQSVFGIIETFNLEGSLRGINRGDLPELYTFFDIFRRLASQSSINLKFAADELKTLLNKLQKTTQRKIDLITAALERTPINIAPEQPAETPDEVPSSTQFYRIEAIGRAPTQNPDGTFRDDANQLPDGRKVGRAARMERFTTEDGEQKIKIFFIDGAGNEKSQVVDWVVDCSGLDNGTATLLSDLVPNQNFGAVRQNVTAAINEFTRNEQSIIKIDTEVENPVLKGAELKNTESVVSRDGSKSFCRFQIRTDQKEEFNLQVVLLTTDGNVKATVIGEDNSQRALLVKRALQRFFEAPGQSGVGTDVSIINRQTPEIGENIQVEPIQPSNPDILLPVGQRVMFNGQPTDITVLGPATRTPLTDREREEVQALSKVNANLASMFRYVPATEEFAKGTLAPKLKETGQYDPDTEKSEQRRTIVIKTVRGELAERAEAALTVEPMSPKGILSSSKKLPRAADPQIVMNWAIEEEFGDINFQKVGEAQAKDFAGVQPKVEIKFVRNQEGQIQYEVVGKELPLDRNIIELRTSKLLRNAKFANSLATMLDGRRRSATVGIELRINAVEGTGEGEDKSSKDYIRYSAPFVDLKLR